MNVSAGEQVNVPSEFFEREHEGEFVKVTIVGPAIGESPEQDEAFHECFIVRLEDGTEGIVYSGFFTPC